MCVCVCVCSRVFKKKTRNLPSFSLFLWLLFVCLFVFLIKYYLQSRPLSREVLRKEDAEGGGEEEVVLNNTLQFGFLWECVWV